jgi:hypothetical protein
MVEATVEATVAATVEERVAVECMAWVDIDLPLLIVPADTVTP